MLAKMERNSYTACVAISHKVTHYYQPTNSSCTATATSMLLSFYGIDKTPEQILSVFLVRKAQDGSDWGSIGQDLARYCIGLGFDATFYSFDCYITDYSWQNFTTQEMYERLKVVRESRDVKCLGGKHNSQLYVDAYMEFIEAGGELKIRPYVTTELIDNLLQQGPVAAVVYYATLYGTGRSLKSGQRQEVLDDTNGKIYTHSVVIVGKDKNNRYQLAEPFKQPGLLWVEREQLVAGITAAQAECDNSLFVLQPKD